MGPKNISTPLQQLAQLEQALVAQPNNIRLIKTLAELQRRMQRWSDAAANFRRAIELRPDDIDSLNRLGLVFRAQRRFDDAERCYRRAITIEPRFVDAHYNLGALWIDEGDPSAGEKHLRDALALKPNFAGAHRTLAKLITHRTHDDDIKNMERLYATDGLADEDRMHLCYGLGKSLEDIGEYAKSFRYLEEANRLMRSQWPYDLDAELAMLDRCIDFFDQALIDNTARIGIEDDAPVFITGMPRSGTSLIEQILASHPSVFGAGELDTLPNLRFQLEVATGTPFPECVTAAPPHALTEMATRYLGALASECAGFEYITDKLPHNFLHIGLISIILPQAKIIHCVRDPMDTCFSLYKSYFPGGGQGYSNNLTDLGTYYRKYTKLMAHWQRQLPGRIYFIRYEDVVSNAEAEIRNLLDHCGVQFDPRCLDFHKTERSIRTNSSIQVRQPLYGDSVRRWKHYERYLHPLEESLR